MPRLLRGRPGIGALVVDDQPDVRRLMCSLLEDHGLFVSGEADLRVVLCSSFLDDGLRARALSAAG